MNKPELIFTTRRTKTMELPLAKNTAIPHPEQVVLKLDNRYFDVGAFCYGLRSNSRRDKGEPREVVITSFLKQRSRQIRQIIKAVSRQLEDGGARKLTICSHVAQFKLFIDHADNEGRYECLSGGDATREAFNSWAQQLWSRYQRHEIGSETYKSTLRSVAELLAAVTGLEHLNFDAPNVKSREHLPGGTEPLPQHDFVRVVALSHALFDGLCNLVLEENPFPYKLELPKTLGWGENQHHLWLFPCNKWYLLPSCWGAEREKKGYSRWAYDYANGCLNTPSAIAHRYKYWRFPSEQLKIAKRIIAQARSRIDAANTNARDRMRLRLGKIAHDAFLLLFLCNTGANGSVTRGIETTGEIHASTLNQQYRSIKFRAQNKAVTVTVPTSFMPSLRRFMVLRKYLLGARSSQFLFFTTGSDYEDGQPTQINDDFACSLNMQLLRDIDPQLPAMGPRRLRASVADWYQRHHDPSITAKILQNSEQTTLKSYDAGSVIDHREEFSRFLRSVSESAKRQRVVKCRVTADGPPLEEGGHCDGFGRPEAMTDNASAEPNCKNSQGCLFCNHRVLVACEDDVRKVASAAFVMEQLILGPQHEQILRPLIIKCDEDIEKIAAFGDSRAMVEQVRNDVFQNGNLTPFFADKFQLFLDLGTIV